MSVKEKFIDLILRGKDLFTPTANAASEELKKLQAESKNTSDELRNLEQTQAAVTRAQGLELYAKNTEVALAAAREEVTRLAREMDAADRPTKEQSEALKLATRSANQLQTEYNKLQLQLTRSKTELQQNGVDTNKLASEQDRLQREVKESAAALNEKRERLRNLRGDMDTTEKSTGKFGEGLRGLTSRLAAFAAAYVGINQLRNAIFSIFETGDKFERLEIQLSSIMGSIEGGQQASAWIKDFTKNTPLQLEEVSQAFVRLKAFGLDPMDGTLQGIVDQAFKMGGTFEEVQGISLALGQAWAKQKLQGEEINQLIERGVPVWQLLEQATGRNTAELQKLSQAGLLGRDVIKSLMEEMARSAEGSAAEAMKALSGLISNAKDNLKEFYNAIATSGALDWLKGQLDSLNKTMAEMAASGELKKLAQSISDGIVATGEAVKSLVTTIYEWRGAIQSVGAAWALLKVGTFLTDLIKGTGQAVTSLMTLVTTKKAAAAANAYYTSTFGPLVTAIGTARSAINAFYLSLTGIGALLAKTGIWAGIAYGIYQLGNLAIELFRTKKANDELKESLQGLSEQEAIWEAELARINNTLRTNISTREELNQVLDAGVISYDAEAEAYRINNELLAQQSDEILKLINRKREEGDANTYITIREQNRLDLQKRLQDAIANTGIITVSSLRETEKQTHETYQTFKEAAAVGEASAYEVEQAFNSWAQASFKVAAATKTAVPETIRLEAANLGLTDQVDELAKKMGLVQNEANRQSKSFSLVQAEINKTKNAIQFYSGILDDSTASTEEKAKATTKLYEAELLLKGQYETLAKIESLRTASFFELKREYKEATRQLDLLNQNYQAGIINTEQYNQQLERQLLLVMTLRGLMPDVQDETDRNTQTQRNAGQQITQTNNSIKDQKDKLEQLTDATEKAKKYTSLLASAQQALRAEFDFTEKSTSELTDRYEELTGWINQNRRAHNEWWRELARASNAAFTREQQIIKETIAMRGYINELEDAGLTLRDLDRISHQLTYQFRELGDSELEVLRQAITDAENRLLSFREELQGTVSSLQDELDRLNDNEAAIEKRRYEQQTAELREKLKAAEASGDRAAVEAAREALKLAEQIYKIKQQQAAEDLKQRNDQNRQTTAAASNNVTPIVRQTVPQAVPAATPISSTTGNSRTVRLVLDLQGRSYNAEMSQNEADRLLAQIERARSTSL